MRSTKKMCLLFPWNLREWAIRFWGNLRKDHQLSVSGKSTPSFKRYPVWNLQKISAKWSVMFPRKKFAFCFQEIYSKFKVLSYYVHSAKKICLLFAWNLHVCAITFGGQSAERNQFVWLEFCQQPTKQINISHSTLVVKKCGDVKSTQVSSCNCREVRRQASPVSFLS